jgi:hypothetical protein
MTPSAPYTGQDFKAQDTRCLFCDDDRLVVVTVSEVRDVEIPTEMEPEDFIRNRFHLSYLWCIDGAVDLPVSWQWKLVELGKRFGYDYSQSCAKVLTKSTKSTFIISLRDALTKWLDGESKYDPPFTSRQYEALTRFDRSNRRYRY